MQFHNLISDPHVFYIDFKKTKNFQKIYIFNKFSQF